MPLIYTFDYQGHSIRAVKIDDEGYISGPDILPLLGYKAPLQVIEKSVDPADIALFYDVPFINKYAIYQLARYACPNPESFAGQRWILVEKNPHKELCEWISHEVIDRLRGTHELPEEQEHRTWSEEDFLEYLQTVQEAEEPYRESKHSDWTPEDVPKVIPLFIGRPRLRLKDETIFNFYETTARMDNSELDFKGFVNGFMFAARFFEYLIDHPLHKEPEQEEQDLKA